MTTLGRIGARAFPVEVDPRTGRARVVHSGGEQSGSRQPHKLEVAGSIPAPATNVWLSFNVMGNPMGAVRQTQRDRWKQRPAVLRYRAWCDAIRRAAGWPAKHALTNISGIRVQAYLPIPASWSVARKTLAHGDYHGCKPDGDNLLKAVCDALFVNDQKLAVKAVEKRWDDGDGCRLEIRIWPL